MILLGILFLRLLQSLLLLKFLLLLQLLLLFLLQPQFLRLLGVLLLLLYPPLQILLLFLLFLLLLLLFLLLFLLLAIFLLQFFLSFVLGVTEKISGKKKMDERLILKIDSQVKDWNSSCEHDSVYAVHESERWEGGQDSRRRIPQCLKLFEINAQTTNV